MTAKRWWAGLAGAALVFSCAQLQSLSVGRPLAQCSAPEIADASARLGDGIGYAFFMLEGQDLERSLAGNVYASIALLEASPALEPRSVILMLLGLGTIALVARRRLSND